MTDILALKCPSCGGKGRLLEGTNRFHCDYCGTESLIQLSFQQMPPTAAPYAPAPESTLREEEVIRPKAPIPSVIRTEQDANGSRIIQRWFSAKYIFMAFFCVVWDGFLCVWYSIVLGGMGLSGIDGGGMGGPPMIFALFPLVHVAVGAYVTYTTIAGFVNRTTVELTHDTLSIYFDPLPWPGEKKIPSSQIKQIYCKENRKTGRHGAVTFIYTLFAVTNEDRQVQILDGLETPEMARYIEQQLETWLRIKDQRVLGEMK